MIGCGISDKLGFFKPDDRVRLSVGGVSYLGQVVEPDDRRFGPGYRGSDEINVIFDELIPGSGIAQGFGLICGVVSTDLELA